jgi:putative Mg2+ transporter-C (MgtC) family protein
VPTLSLGELIARVALAAVLGGAIGLERELSDQSAGFRTHILVTLGAALFTLAGSYGLEDFYGDPGTRIRVDPTRVAAQVVTGIGFLGAGAIIQRGINARGLTTAAALWVTAAIGTAIGLGYIVGAVTITVTALIVLAGLKLFERRALERFRKGLGTYKILVHHRLRLGELSGAIDDLGGDLRKMQVNEDEPEQWRITASVQLPPGVTSDQLIQRLREVPEVVDVDTGV